MRRRTLIACLGATLLSSLARADGNSTPEPTAPTALSDQELLAESLKETVEIFDERPDKPFDRDTEVRLTGEQLAARGAIDLGSALELLPDVTVRDAGRGGFNIDVRGGRKGEVSILVDGVLVTDPYYGTFDVAGIPITDIVQIRVSTTPQSPIDGPGGSGGVIEVLTRDAIGPQLVIARLTGDTLPSSTMTGTMRTELVKHLALRVSASGLAGGRDYTLATGLPALPEDRHAASGTSRLEYRDGDRRIALDVFIDDRHYIPPPADDASTGFTLIERETSKRVSIKADDKWGGFQVQAEGWVHALDRTTLNFSDAAFLMRTGSEVLTALRTGGEALVTKPINQDWRWAASAVLDHESATDTLTSGVTPSIGQGDTTVLETAGDAQYEHKKLRVDLAVGVAFPFGVATDPPPWLEAKLNVKYRVRPDLELSLTGGRKGRVPSLRERFDPADGNPGLGPEMNNHIELRAVENIQDRLHLEAAPFYRYQTGTIASNTNDKGRFDSIGDANIYGVDLISRVRVHRMAELGAAYSYIRAKTDTSADAINRLPRNKLEGWVQATPDPRVALLARVKYFGDSIDMGSAVVKGYTLVEASASAQITKQYLTVLRVDDLLDARPQDRAGFSGPGRVISLVLQGNWD
jgi:vitamin B12 transporter